MPSLLYTLLFSLSCALQVFSSPIELQPRLLGLNVTLPSQDDFYQPPAGWESTQPGAILAYRSIETPAVIDLVSPGLVKATWQILYRSTDDSGNPLATVTTLFVPRAGDSNKLFTQSIAYDSSDVDCSPSYTLRSLTTTNPDVALIALGLYDGWFVQSPDFEGYASAFTNGIISGQNMLDSLRAVLASGSFSGISSTARMALNGGSGGALAIEWAIEIQPQYAPDVNIAGVTLGSLTPNIANVMAMVNGGAFAGLTPSSITGLAKKSSAMAKYLNDTLVPATKDEFMSAQTRCLNDNQAYYASQDIKKYFITPDFLQDEVPSQIFSQIGVMGTHGVPQVPMYIYKGAEDEISNVDDTDALVEKYCHSGAPSIVYIRDIVTGHEAESFLGAVGAYEYLQERLNGIPPLEGCTIINSTKSTLNNTDATALGNLGTTVINILENALPALLTT